MYIGAVFLVIVLQNVFTHLFMLIFDSIRKIIILYKIKKAKLKSKLSMLKDRKRRPVQPLELAKLPQHH